MPFKNESAHLKETIESIQNQTYSNFEVIAIDDHSSDNSYEFLEEVSKSDPRFSVYKNTGTGIIEALKTASQHILGDYVTRQDADDLMPSTKLENLLELLKNAGRNHIATGRVEYFSHKDMGNGFLKYENWLNSLCENDNHYSQIYKECVLVSSNWLLYIEDFNKLGGYQDAIYPEDYHFVFKLFTHDFKIVSSKNVTHLWRDHEHRASRNLEQYRDQKFFPLKVQFFKEIVGVEKICLWGAGPTGKKLAKELIKNEIPFIWITNNEKKIGKNIYGVKVQHFSDLEHLLDHHLIISVTQRDAIASIFEYLESIHFKNHYEF
ncbi:hypothetical protein A9Q84_06885 [Halobacteriovorax marinus]|uniref:Glycosyltransferase 2-like domain-containing protein n=1 Tax=Halobacteriovorax marinus TaxID=97084 RepID=A0A1Y5FDZ0_9BACT|nr:hypothetical protein A9Q84_06885 [Halobacteriovorax marinus]